MAFIKFFLVGRMSLDNLRIFLLEDEMFDVGAFIYINVLARVNGNCFLCIFADI